MATDAESLERASNARSRWARLYAIVLVELLLTIAALAWLGRA